jgi:hypothetical protein
MFLRKLPQPLRASIARGRRASVERQLRASIDRRRGAPIERRLRAPILPMLLVLLMPLATATPSGGQIPGGAMFDSLATPPPTPPEKVRIDMIFLAFDGSVRSRPVGRTRMQADSLARALLVVARSGVDFDSLRTARSDEPKARPLVLVNKGFRPGPGERTRKMVEPAVGDMAFGMLPGQTGLVVPNNTTCKYGYYLVRRLADESP